MECRRVTSRRRKCKNFLCYMPEWTVPPSLSPELQQRHEELDLMMRNGTEL